MSSPNPNLRKKKQEYNKVDPITHILKRPDMYTGSTRPRVSSVQVSSIMKGEYSIYTREINLSPAFLRIFVEPLSNAIDNIARSTEESVVCSYIRVVINQETGLTSVENDGQIVPIEMNEAEKCYNHTLIFGQLLTSSNYDDTNERYDISGRNGMGVKVCNVFSKFFEVVGVDPQGKKKLRQVWRNNMRSREEVEVEVCEMSRGYTKVSWIPDFVRFGYIGYTDELISLFKKYTIDTAMIASKHKIKVYFNDELIPINSLLDYSLLYYSCRPSNILQIKDVSGEVVVVPSSSGYKHVSFVNGVYTSNGGTHVNACSEGIFRPLIKKLSTISKHNFTVGDVKKFFHIYINMTVSKPEFDSQSKNILESPVSITFSPKQISPLFKWTVIDDIIRSKDLLALKKTERKKRVFTSIDGLDPANLAGTSKSSECILIVVEGLSAKTFAVQGIEVGAFGKKGRDYFGVYALRGKLLNVRNADITTIAKNAVVSNIVKALGVRYEGNYLDEEDYKTLQYGKVMIITDQDCLTLNTPVIKKDGNIVPISYIKRGDYIRGRGKWVQVLEIRKKETTKPILEICTSKKVVTCTADHRIILENGKEIYARDLKIGDKLVHEEGVEFLSLEISQDNCMFLAAIYSGGMFVGRGKLVIILDKRHRKFLEILRDVLINRYPSFSYQVSDANNCSCILFIDVPLVFEEWITELIRKFYIDEFTKIVPYCILSSSRRSKSIFMNTLRMLGGPRIYVSSQVGLQTLSILADSIGQAYRIRKEPERNYMFEIIDDVIEYSNEIRSINIVEKDKLVEVIDIETEGEHIFCAGGILVHNCDGLHISGLIQNMFHSLFPTLLEREEPFLVSMQTPIVRVFLPGKELLFYDEHKYQKYVLETGGEGVGWGGGNKKIKKKYYKGLGSSSSKDIMNTFGKKLIEFENDEQTSITMNKVFHKKQSNLRKEWLRGYSNTNCILNWEGDGEEIKKMSISSFLDTEMIKFSIDDCKRSIPNVIDGLKQGQRKILFSCFKRKLSSVVKVAQLAGYVAEHSGYHHGECILYDTIVKLAQCFVGSNNIPLLYRDGQFGCVDPETIIPMWMRRNKKAKYIRVNDLLIGDDGLPRKVLKICMGKDEMYKIKCPDNFTVTVNSKHILTLYHTTHRQVFKQGGGWEWIEFDGIREVIKYSKNYVLSSSPVDRIFDIPLVQYLSFPKELKSRLQWIKNREPFKYGGEERSKHIDAYKYGRDLYKCENKKYLPSYLLYGDLEVRQNLYNGLIHSEAEVGEYRVINLKNIYHPQLVKDIESLCLSLGYIVYLGGTEEYPILNINMKRDEIITSSFTVEYIGMGRFNGWEVDGNGRFLLENGSVTHNSRIAGGTDAASARYIFTRLEKITRMIYKTEDDELLNYIEDDGDKVEPRHYVPIIPMILVNGISGAIGTGWSCSIPAYNPLDLINAVRTWIKEGHKILYKVDLQEESISLIDALVPWYRDYTGKIEKEKNKDGRFISWGRIREEGNKMIVDELPVGMWTDQFKIFLEKLVENKDIQSMKNYSTPTKVKFVIRETSSGIKCNLKNLKLFKYLFTSNMVMFDSDEKLKKYESIDEVIDEFCGVRYKYYKLRKINELRILGNSHNLLSNKRRFLQDVLDGEIRLFTDAEGEGEGEGKGKKKNSRLESDLVKELEVKKYDKVSGREGEKSYDYLLRLQFRNITREKIDSLQEEINILKEKIDKLTLQTEDEIWLNDLQELEEYYVKWIKTL